MARVRAEYNRSGRPITIIHLLKIHLLKNFCRTFNLSMLNNLNNIFAIECFIPKILRILETMYSNEIRILMTM